ncbi:MAG: AmmeMemoRadiSam system protein B [Desulfobacterales bacterium]
MRPARPKLTALILPHAGYVYSGPVAAHAGRALKNQTIKKIILMGPDHRIGFSDSAIPDASFFQTPLGKIPISPDAAELIQQQPALFHVLPLSMDREHSGLAKWCFRCCGIFWMNLTLCRSPRETPIPEEGLAAAIEPIRDPETLLVASSDLSHYLPYDAAKQKDQKTIRQILALDVAALSGGEENAACGILPIKTILHLARQHVGGLRCCSPTPAAEIPPVPKPGGRIWGHCILRKQNRQF